MHFVPSLDVFQRIKWEYGQHTVDAYNFYLLLSDERILCVCVDARNINNNNDFSYAHIFNAGSAYTRYACAT